ncbi:hypothetical protein Q7P37_009638 [Cladosporium fusiforme]
MSSPTTAMINTTAIPTVLKILSLAATAMGSGNLLLGSRMVGASSIFHPKTPVTALAESQIRYLGGVFASTGAIIWWISDDVGARLFPLAALGSGIVVGGLGRAIAGWKHGFPQENVRQAMWIEFVLPAAFWAYGRVKGVW